MNHGVQGPETQKRPEPITVLTRTANLLRSCLRELQPCGTSRFLGENLADARRGRQARVDGSADQRTATARSYSASSAGSAGPETPQSAIRGVGVGSPSALAAIR